MKKIRLDVDSLEVVSFDTVNVSLDGRGTVRGAFRPGQTVGWENTECQELSPTWQDSCGCPETQGAECETQAVGTCLTCLGVSCYLHGCTGYTCDGSVTCAGSPCTG